VPLDHAPQVPRGRGLRNTRTIDLLEAEGWDYVVRIKGNPKLHEQIGWLTKRCPGRPPNQGVRRYTSFHCRAKSWSKALRVVAKVEFYPGELFSPVSASS